MGVVMTHETQEVGDKTVEEFVEQIRRHRRNTDLNIKKSVSVSLTNQALLIQESRETSTNLSIGATMINGELIPFVKSGTNSVTVHGSRQYLGELYMSELDLFSNVLAACECCRLTQIALVSAKTNDALIKHIARCLGFFIEHETFITSFIMGINSARWREPTAEEVKEKSRQIKDILTSLNKDFKT